MVQTFMVVRCFQCETFQVELVKKSTKWKCKVCAAIQSVRQVYGKGPASDCRRHVQKLNMARGQAAMEQQRAQLSSPPEQYEEDGPIISEGVESPRPVLLQAEGSSRWAAFISSAGQEEGEGEGEDCMETSSGYHFTADVMKYQMEKKKRRKDPPEKDGKRLDTRSEGVCARMPEDRSATCDGAVCKEALQREQSLATHHCRGPDGEGLSLQARRWDQYKVGGGCLDGPHVGKPLPSATGERKLSCPMLRVGRENDTAVLHEGGWESSLGKIGWKSASYKVADT